MAYIDLLKCIWSSIYDPNTKVEEIVEQYFHPDYEQCINGEVMDRPNYIKHVLEQKKAMRIDSIDYQHFLEQGNELFALYYPRGKNIKNAPVEAEVIAYFRFENQKIVRIHGQVRLIQGDLSDVDMSTSE